MRTERRHIARYRLTPLATALCLALGLSGAPAFAQEEAASAAKKDKVTELLEKLKAKGIISNEEYDELTGNTPEGRAEARAERRKKATQEALETQKAEAAKERYNGRWNNGITFATPDNRNTFNLSGRVHADYRYFDGDTAASTFDVRRAYMTLAGKWNEWLTWDVTGDFAQATTSATGAQSNGGSVLDVAWVNAAWSDALQFRAGQFKMPFALEELGSSRFLDFQERSYVDRLAPAKERGLMLHGFPSLGTTYAIALSNGQGKNNNEVSPTFDSPDLIARGTVNVAELLGQQAKAVYHFGIAGSMGEHSTNATTIAPIGSQNTEARGATWFTPTSFNTPFVDRTRAGFETALAYGPVKLQGEWATVGYKGSATGQQFDKSIDAYYVGLSWMITGERYSETYRNGVFGRMVPIQNYTPGGSSWGAWELGFRASQFDASDFPLVAGASNAATLAGGQGGTYVGTSLANPTAANKAESYTIGLKWIWTPNFKIYANYVETHFDSPIAFAPTGGTSFRSDRERAFTMRAAFDF